MSTQTVLASKLGITTKTIRNNLNDGYTLVLKGCGAIDIDKSIHAYVKYQSEKIRLVRKQRDQKKSGNTGNTKEPESLADWSLEKEKQGAIKLQLQNDKDVGELIPVDAMFELYNAPLSLVKSKLLDLSNQIQKRMALDPEQVKMINDVIGTALQGLNEKGDDELQIVIQQIIQRYSKYYNSAEQDSDLAMV